MWITININNDWNKYYSSWFTRKIYTNLSSWEYSKNGYNRFYYLSVYWLKISINTQRAIYYICG